MRLNFLIKYSILISESEEFLRCICISILKFHWEINWWTIHIQNKKEREKEVKNKNMGEIMEKIQTTLLARNFMKEAVKEGSLVVDATVGRGFDTAYLCKLVGEQGKVIGFDIQEEAIESAKERLKDENLQTPVQLILDSHANMGKYIEEESVDGIMFNFGYLPNGDHTIATKPESSIQAIENGLSLLKKGGVISLCIYHGKDTGFEERDAILEYLKTISHKKYTVVVTELYNRPNNPPIFAGIVRDK